MKNKVLITGAASGLGEALALQYAKHGFEVCIVDIDIVKGEKVAQHISQTTDKTAGSAFFLTCDITKEDEIQQLKSQLLQRWGRIDILINNAGVATAGALEYEDLEQWQWVININLYGMIRMCRAFVPLMKSQHSGRLVNIASQAAITPISLMASYNASKAAVVSFSETMYLELAANGINVSVACPSFFATNLDKSLRSTQAGMAKLVGKMLQRSEIDANDVAQQIFTASESNKFMIITHKKGRHTFRMKKFLPFGYYLNLTKKKLTGFGPKSKN